MVQPFAALRVVLRSVAGLMAGFILHQSFHTDAASTRTGGKQGKQNYNEYLFNHGLDPNQAVAQFTTRRAVGPKNGLIPRTPKESSVHSGPWQNSSSPLRVRDGVPPDLYSV